jgi:hypothetical protein
MPRERHRGAANESEAKAIVQNGTLGDLSVTWCKDLGLWLMTYDRRAPTHGIAFSYSRTPWGPWSEPQILFNGANDGLGKFIHNPNGNPPDGLAGPVIGKGQMDPEAVHGGAYAPYVVERWTKLSGSELNVELRSLHLESLRRCPDEVAPDGRIAVALFGLRS